MVNQNPIKVKVFVCDRNQKKKDAETEKRKERNYELTIKSLNFKEVSFTYSATIRCENYKHNENF